MCYFDIKPKLLNNNVVLVGKRDSGKTMLLKKYFYLYTDLGYKVMVIDSATEHVEKSLLEYVIYNFTNIIRINTPRRSKICNLETVQVSFKYFKNDIYPSSIIESSGSNTICVDVSKYLEMGYSTENLELRKRIRLLYKIFVLQCLSAFWEHIVSNKTIIIMDEIEFIPEIRPCIEKYNEKGIYFINALHDIESLSTSKNLFTKI